jgi:uncharacterized protein (DUF4415 family)
MSKLTQAQIAEIETKLRALPEPDLTDPDTPEWTVEDFARAGGPESLSAAELRAFPKTRGRPRLAQAKQPVSLRLSPDVLAYYKAMGEGWQGQIEAVLKAAMLAKTSGKPG